MLPLALPYFQLNLLPYRKPKSLSQKEVCTLVHECHTQRECFFFVWFFFVFAFLWNTHWRMHNTLWCFISVLATCKLLCFLGIACLVDMLRSCNSRPKRFGAQFQFSWISQHNVKKVNIASVDSHLPLAFDFL